MLSQLRLTAVIGICAVLLSASCNIGAQPVPTKYSALAIEVKPGMQRQFEEFIHKFRDAVEKNRGPQRWLANAAVSGSPVYTFTREFGTWTEFGQDAPEPLVAAYGEQEAGRLLGLLQSSVACESTTIYVARPDLSRPAPANAASTATPVAVRYIDVNVKLGKEQQFESYMKKVIEATNATAPNAFFQTRQRMFGPGNSSGYRVDVEFQKWSDLDTPDKPPPQRLTEHFGAAEGERLEALGNDSITGFSRRLNRVRADLGRPPAN
jgi:hypothetical protein